LVFWVLTPCSDMLGYRVMRIWLPPASGLSEVEA